MIQNKISSGSASNAHKGNGKTGTQNIKRSNSIKNKKVPIKSPNTVLKKAPKYGIELNKDLNIITSKTNFTNKVKK